MPLKKDEINVAIESVIKGWKKEGYVIPVRSMNLCLDIQMGNYQLSDLSFLVALLPEKAEGWFIKRVMEVSKEIFGDSACSRVSGTYHLLHRKDKSNKRWKAAVAFSQRYWEKP